MNPFVAAVLNNIQPKIRFHKVVLLTSRILTHTYLMSQVARARNRQFNDERDTCKRIERNTGWSRFVEYKENMLFRSMDND